MTSQTQKLTRYSAKGKHRRKSQRYKWSVLQKMLWCGSKYHPPVIEPHKPCRTTSRVWCPIVRAPFLADNWSYTTDLTAVLTHFVKCSCYRIYVRRVKIDGHFRMNTSVEESMFTKYPQCPSKIGYMVNWLVDSFTYCTRSMRSIHNSCTLALWTSPTPSPSFCSWS